MAPLGTLEASARSARVGSVRAWSARSRIRVRSDCSSSSIEHFLHLGHRPPHKAARSRRAAAQRSGDIVEWQVDQKPQHHSRAHPAAEPCQGALQIDGSGRHVSGTDVTVDRCQARPPAVLATTRIHDGCTQIARWLGHRVQTIDAAEEDVVDQVLGDGIRAGHQKRCAHQHRELRAIDRFEMRPIAGRLHRTRFHNRQQSRPPQNVARRSACERGLRRGGGRGNLGG